MRTSGNAHPAAVWLTLLLTAVLLCRALPGTAAQEESRATEDTEVSLTPSSALSRQIATRPFLEWSTWDVQYLYGFNWNLGNNPFDTITFEHADSWRYGDNYFFLDVYNVTENVRSGAATYLYGEWHPRFSLSKLSGVDFSWGLLRDVLLANELNFSDVNHFFSHCHGVGLSLALPGFSFANVNVFARDDRHQPGVTWQIKLDWLIPFRVQRLSLSYGGYIGFAGAEGPLSSYIIAETQLLLDVGEFFQYRNRLFVGVEFKCWRNEFGIPSQTEYMPQPMVKWVF